jgi:hypothetical protein
MPAAGLTVPMGSGKNHFGANARGRAMGEREGAMHFTGVKVFSATKAKEREELGESVTRWLRSNTDLEIVDRIVSQSSDDEFHCLSIALIYRQKADAPA